MDNAATSWPKPPQVIEAMADFLERAGGNPGRSGHRLSIEAGRIVYNTRETVAEFFNVPDPMRVIFTPNATYALNTAIRGLLRPGDEVVTTSIEHNSVMRPLRALEREGIELTVVKCAPDASLDPRDIEKSLRDGVRLVVMNHASNVVGTVLPVAEIAEIAHRYGALLLVDAAQTAGCLPIDIQEMRIDLLAFTGHKSLLGPTGTGGLAINDTVNVGELVPLLRGGTGSRSKSEEQPEDLPDKYESGTTNAVGLAGLKAGIDYVTAEGINEIRRRESEFVGLLLEGLSAIPGVTVYCSNDISMMTGAVSFTSDRKSVSEIGLELDIEFGVLSRVGLHCSPALHRTIGTFPEGTVRLAPGPFTTRDDIASVIAAVEGVAGI
ncbi:MAG: aminotransferase class V-fold PLP-dependent enzyme [bacterium]|nr:aminotransferase class V-fold PLP-dependent enzyme [bacterium]